MPFVVMLSWSVCFVGFVGLNFPVNASKMCTNPSGLRHFKMGVLLPATPILTTKTEGVMICARLCLLRRRCASFSFNTVSGECHLNHKGIDTAVSIDEQLNPSENFVFSEISHWPQKLAGSCADHVCPLNTYCDPIGETNHTCVPSGCLGSPSVSNGNLTSLRETDESSIGTNLTRYCRPGYLPQGHVICQEDGVWSSGRCKVISSCRMVKECRPDSEDGEYWLRLPNFDNYKTRIYCHRMNSTSPVEYLTLAYANYGIYPVMSNLNCGTEKNYLEYSCVGQGGEVWFYKIRINIDTMEVELQDGTFANLTNFNLAYGVVTDCYSAHENHILSKCGTKGRFTIDLRGTGWKVGPDQEWETWGWKAIVEQVLVGANGTVVNLKCGGFRGGCTPAGELLLEPFPDGLTTTSNDLVCT